MEGKRNDKCQSPNLPLAGKCQMKSKCFNDNYCFCLGYQQVKGALSMIEHLVCFGHLSFDIDLTFGF